MFYKLENGEILESQIVTMPDMILVDVDKDNYSYPVNGWHWFDTKEKAQVLLTNPTLNTISMRQARLELLNRNLLDTVDTMVLQLSRAAQIEWEYATEIKRDNPLVIQLANALNLSPVDMDGFYRVAATL